MTGKSVQSDVIRSSILARAALARLVNRKLVSPGYSCSRL